MQSQYYPMSDVPTNAPTLPREDNAQRKRPKYTRSKTGCLTCRVKKIKVPFLRVLQVPRSTLSVCQCDESKPICIRCTHSQRDVRRHIQQWHFADRFCQCTWPEGVPVDNDSISQEYTTDDHDGRPLIAESSGMSDTSTPPTRTRTPPNGLPLDLGLLPLVPRSQR
jgi:hypothetical protein